MPDNETPNPKDAEVFAEVFERFVNNFGVASEAVKAAAILARSHRTLQQGIYATCLAILLGLSKNGTDLRNESAVEGARKALDALGIKDEHDLLFMRA